MTTTIFTFGYFGWGNHTADLVKAVDAVEKARGFQPPVFVDIRIRRAVRAPGFNGGAFGKLLGEDRYRWMNSLGNEAIVNRRLGRVKIADPDSAVDLLQLARSSAKEGRRVIYFCGCRWPRMDGRLACHRTSVMQLLMRAARREERLLQVVEWPGGKPGHVDFNLEPELFSTIAKGRMTIPRQRADVELRGLPWGSIATLRCGDDTIHRIVGPALRQTEQWVLPVQPTRSDREFGFTELNAQAAKFRKSHGLESVVA